MRFSVSFVHLYFIRTNESGILLLQFLAKRSNSIPLNHPARTPLSFRANGAPRAEGEKYLPCLYTANERIETNQVKIKGKIKYGARDGGVRVRTENKRSNWSDSVASTMIYRFPRVHGHMTSVKAVGGDAVLLLC